MKNALEPSRPGAIVDGGTARQLAVSSIAENTSDRAEILYQVK